MMLSVENIVQMKRSSKTNRQALKPPSVPTEQDWGDYASDLDRNHAHSVFARRTNDEMQPFFRRNVIEMTDELRWMPDKPFRYYVLGFRNFVMARQFEFLSSADAASCFLGLVLEKLEKKPRQILPIMPELLADVEYVAKHQELFEADEKIYGNFLDKLARINDAYAQHRST